MIVLLTGASGFLGRHVARHLARHGHEVVAVARTLPSDEEGMRWVASDLLQPDAARLLVAAAHPELLVHLAWHAGPGESWSAPENLEWVGATSRLHEAFFDGGGRRAVSAGSYAEYDWASAVLDDVAGALKPATLYGTCKAAAWTKVAKAAAASGKSAAWGRLFCLYGPGEPPGALVADVVISVLQGQPIDCPGGLPQRDFMHVDDAARALVGLLDSDVHGAVNIASGICRPVREVLLEIGRQLDGVELIRLGQRPPTGTEPPRLEASIGRLRGEVGFSPEHDLASGIVDTIAWWRTELADSAAETEPAAMSHDDGVELEDELALPAAQAIGAGEYRAEAESRWEDVTNIFRLFLGRDPESDAVFEGLVGIGLEALLLGVLSSREFQDVIRAPLMAGEAVRSPPFHSIRALRAAVVRLPISAEGLAAAERAGSVSALRIAVVSDPVFRGGIPDIEQHVAGLEMTVPQDALPIAPDDVANTYRLLLGQEAADPAMVPDGEWDLFAESLINSDEFLVRVREPMMAGRPVVGRSFAHAPTQVLRDWAARLPLSNQNRAKVARAASWHVLHSTLFGDPVLRACLPEADAALAGLDATNPPPLSVASSEDVINSYRILLGREPESSAMVALGVGLPRNVVLMDKMGSEEFELRVRRPMLARQRVDGGVFAQPPAAELKEWAVGLPLSTEGAEAVAEASSWYDLHVALFRDPVFRDAVPEMAEQLEALVEILPPVVAARPGRKEIPEHIRMSYPLTDRFFDRLKWLDRVRPKVSIVILSYCRPDLVENLIRSIWLFSTGYSYEIIVVDNGSPPGEHELARVVEDRTQVIRLHRNHYLGDAYNIGVEHAKGAFIVLMNNDIVVESDWLEPLVGLLERDVTVGAVGPKFLYPTGQLQEAGAIIDSTGYSIQLGKRGTADAPEFNAIREVHYCTGATIAVRRDTYIDLQGYDWRWSPGYYEDVDLCFKMRARGMRVLYTPYSSVFHIESATMVDRPPSSNLSSAVDNNRRRFVAKWRALLEGEPGADAAGRAQQGVGLQRYRAVVQPGVLHERRVAVFFPYEFIPGGGEKFALSIAEQLAGDAEIYLVFEHEESVLRIISVLEDLGFPEFPFHPVTLEAARAMPAFDVFILIGNELFPTRPAMGRRNFFICQFPFPVPRDFLQMHHDLGHHKAFETYIVYSDYVRTRVQDMLHEWHVRIPVQVLSPTTDLVGEREAKANHIVGVGRFFVGGHNKRHDVMIEVMRLVEQMAPELGATLDLAGALHNGAEHREHLQGLRERAEALPVSFHIDILRRDLDVLYREAKVYLHAGGWDVDTIAHPEAAEHFGITILEAMSAGCIPIVYAAGGPAEIVKHGVNGFLVVGIQEMADWTVKILRNWDTPAMRDIRAQALSTAAKYDKPVFRDRMRDIGLSTKVDTLASTA